MSHLTITPHKESAEIQAQIALMKRGSARGLRRSSTTSIIVFPVIQPSVLPWAVAQAN